jgi:hypothetical protein
MDPKLTHVQTSRIYQLDAAAIFGMLPDKAAFGPDTQLTGACVIDGFEPGQVLVEFEVTSRHAR